ncbi:MAG: hypothetical protein ACRCWQ_13720 [Bacilli bacterium]
MNKILTKTLPKSFFKRADLRSPLADKLFCDTIVLNSESVTVLQIMLVGETSAIFELIYTDDLPGGD